MHIVKVGLLFLLVPMIAACSGTASNAVSAVTPLPTEVARSGFATTTPLPTSEDPTATATEAEPTQTDIPAEATEEAAQDDDDTAAVDASAADENSLANAPSVNDLETTPTVQTAGLEPGVAREIALATDIPMQPEIENPLTFDESPVPLTFGDFYSGYDIRRGMLMSDKILSLDGEQVVIEGYVAPPLKPRIDFFVLTRIQLAFCPFCSADTEWPTDIALVYMPQQDIVDTQYPVRVTGRLEVGSSTDAETGMVSLVRIYMEEMEQIR